MKFSFRLLLLLIPACCSFSSSAQLTVSTGITPLQLVQNFLGSGISISNISYTGSISASGTFNGAASNIGLAGGVLLTTGAIINAPGPNNSGSSGTDNMLGGDSLLDSLAGVPTFDATLLEFDFIPSAATIGFRYVFASEEYNEFVCGNVNDVFGFFISGPGITGVQNLVFIPGTTIPVSINTLNNGSCGGSYTFHAGCDTSHANFFIDNTSGTTVQYDGFTTVLTAQAVVTPGSTYHIKLVIADGGDGSFDSGVFLEAGSFAIGIPALPVANDELIFEIRPNPAGEYIVVSSSVPFLRRETKPKLTIFDLVGKEIFSESLIEGNTKLKTSDWNNGVYFVQVKTQNKVLTRKLIIRH